MSDRFIELPVGCDCMSIEPYDMLYSKDGRLVVVTKIIYSIEASAGGDPYVLVSVEAQDEVGDTSVINHKEYSHFNPHITRTIEDVIYEIDGCLECLVDKEIRKLVCDFAHDAYMLGKKEALQ